MLAGDADPGVPRSDESRSSYAGPRETEYWVFMAGSKPCLKSNPVTMGDGLDLAPGELTSRLVKTSPSKLPRDGRVATIPERPSL